jgi:hypothetical protein
MDLGLSSTLRTAPALCLLLGLGACTSVAPPAPAPGEELLGLSAHHELLRFRAGAPQHILERRSINGLAPGDQLVGLDYRVARGVLFALARQRAAVHAGCLPAVQHTNAVGSPTRRSPRLHGPGLGFDFNPAADRIRVVTDAGAEPAPAPRHRRAGRRRPHPARRAARPRAALRLGRRMHAGRAPHLVAAGYTYHQRDDKLTTNYAIDAALGTLVLQGSREGAQPVVSPNTGQLRTVGPLGLGPLVDASFDISDVQQRRAAGGAHQPPGTHGAVPRGPGHRPRPSALGVVGDGAPLRGLAIVP